jgi:hypothetical protein
MKKFVITTVLALAATAASAVEVGVTAARVYGDQDRNFGGITIGEHYGKLSATVGFERSTAGNNDIDRVSLVGGYDVAKIGSVVVTPKLGVAYLDRQVGADGYALTVGIGASVPVSKQVRLGVDVARQYGQDRVDTLNGNRVGFSAKYSF